MAAKRLLLLGLLLLFLCKQGRASFDYGQALSKSILYFEAQRSGKLPSTQRVLWRGDSALKDGSDVGVDLTGGYFDSGDNVKFGFPLAFTVTLLAWSAVDFGAPLRAKKEFGNALRALRWGTDYLIKAHAAPDVLYVQVSDGQSDHDCWQRSDEMTTPRPSHRIDSSKPGADASGQTAAALAAASIVFRRTKRAYSNELVSHARQLFDFARSHPGLYQDSVPAVKPFYSSSGFEDELVWASAWLHRATGQPAYLNFLASANTGGTRTLFSWDDKFTGAHALVSKLILARKVGKHGKWAEYQTGLDQFICNVIQRGNNKVKNTPGGALWWLLPFDNFQYTTSALLVILSHANDLSRARANLQCSGGTVTPNDLVNFARSQVDYILGANPNRMSYMVGFGSRYPKQVHHRGASIVSIKKNPTPVSCKGGFDAWFRRNAPNPNVIEGAVVGGPDANDRFSDSRSNFKQAEAATVTAAPLVGVLALLA